MKSPRFLKPVCASRHFFGVLAVVTLSAATSVHGLQAYTAADLPGPDGIIYPDWRSAGIAGGIPGNLVVRATINSAQNTDISAAIESAAQTAAAAGGGVVAIPAGTYNLNRPVFMRQNNVVIRGAGRDGNYTTSGTRLVFRFQAPVNDVVFFQHPAGATTLYNNTFLQAHADPNGLNRIAIYVKKADGSLALCTEHVKTSGSWGFTFSIGTTGSVIRGLSATGAQQVVARAEYDDGRVLTRTATYTLQNSTDPNATPASAQSIAAINFCGAGVNTGNILLTASASRGDMDVQVPSGHGIVAGDLVEIHAPRTKTWDEQLQNTCTTSDTFRVCIYKVASVTSTSITFTQPMRIDYPIADGPDVTKAFVRRFVPIKRCGLENFTVEQPYNVWTNGLIFSWAYECWATNVKVKKAGRMPIYFSPAKNCEVRDSICDDAWYKGEAGTAYCGFERAYDCLMDNMATFALRHAALVQWSASGNVIRNSVFTDSDAQWHSGWTNENLFENCTVLSNRGNGGYGYGMWASGPDDPLHGPNGPRNTVYNCDVTSPLAGVWLGGRNQNWLFLHNRIAADRGPGVSTQIASANHRINGNVFVLRDPSTGAELSDANCTGVELASNQFLGALKWADLGLGKAQLAGNTGNSVTDLLHPLTPAQAFTYAGFESGGFGTGTNAWVASDGGMSVVSNAAAHTGTQGVRVTGVPGSSGSSLLSQAFTVVPGKVYAARAYCRLVPGSPASNQATLSLRFYNGSTQLRTSGTTIGNTDYWTLEQAIDVAPPSATSARIWVHTYSTSGQAMDMDDFSFGELSHEMANGDFELGAAAGGAAAEGWINTGDNGMSTAVASAAQSGSYGLHVSDTSNTLGSSYATPRFPITAGNTCQARFWSRVTSGSGLGVYLRFYDSNGDPVSAPDAFIDVPANAAWAERLVRHVAPAGAASVSVLIHSYSGAIVQADLDEFVFSELPPRPTPSVASIFDWQRNPAYPLINPGFQSDLSGWSTSGDNGMSAADGAASRSGAAGTTGLRVTDASATLGSSVTSQDFPIAEGYQYKMSFYAKLISGSGIGVYLTFTDANGAQVGSSNIMDVPASATSWTPLSLTATAPAGAVKANIRIHSYIASIVTAYFDDFSFRAVW